MDESTMMQVMTNEARKRGHIRIQQSLNERTVAEGNHGCDAEELVIASTRLNDSGVVTTGRPGCAR